MNVMCYGKNALKIDLVNLVLIAQHCPLNIFGL